MATNNKKNSPAASGITGLLFILAIIIILILLVRGCSDKMVIDDSEETPTASSLTPEQTPDDVDDADESPSHSPSESPEPASTPEPTPAPTPVQNITASGSFSSDTGVGVNTTAQWKAVSAGSGKVTVTVDLYLNSYTLNVNANPGGARFSIGGTTVSANIPKLAIDAPNSLVKTPLASASVTLSLGSDGTLSIPIKAEWLFGGTYSDAELDIITAEGTATIS